MFEVLLKIILLEKLLAELGLKGLGVLLEEDCFNLIHKVVAVQRAIQILLILIFNFARILQIIFYIHDLNPYFVAIANIVV